MMPSEDKGEGRSSSDHGNTGWSPKKVSPDVIEKLNNAFSSYIDGKAPEDSDIDLSETGSIMELIGSDSIEEDNSDIKNNQADNGSAICDDDQTGPLDCPSRQSELDEPEIPSFPDVDKHISDKISGVFDDVTFQSVDPEIEETQQLSVNEDKEDYSSILSDILEKGKENSHISLDQHMSAIRQDVRNEEDKRSFETEALHDKAVHKEKIADVSPAYVHEPVISEHKQKNPVTASETVSGSMRVKTNDVRGNNANISKPFSSSKQKEPVKPSPKKTILTTTKDKNKNEGIGVQERPVHGKSRKNDPALESPVNIAFLFSRDHLFHDPSSLSIVAHERPERIIKAMWYLEKNNVFNDSTCKMVDEFCIAEEEDLLRVHEDSYISFIRSYADSGGGFLGDSTYITPASYDIARMSAGAAIKAGELVLEKEFSHAFVMTRPPGHHASSEKYGGFCLFNNAAVLARYLQKKRNVGKVLILDWDAHAGDGTMDIFYDDPSVMLISLHRDPHGFYPRKGFSTQVGENAGKGFTMNVEMPEGSGNDEYMLAFDEVVIPMISQFAPDVIICSCGFDGYYKEKSVGLNLDSMGYHQMTSGLHSVFKGPMVFLLEGGYHDSNGHLCHSVLSSLQGKPNPVNDAQEISSYKLNLQKKVFEDTQKNIEALKKHHPLLFSKVA